MAQAILPLACEHAVVRPLLPHSLSRAAIPQQLLLPQPSLPVCTLYLRLHPQRVALDLTHNKGGRFCMGLRGDSSVDVSESPGTANFADLDLKISGALMVPVMKKSYGSFGGATLEKAKLDLSQRTMKVNPQTEDGGGGGDIGKRINNGGGDGGDDGGDDDSYFADGDDGDEGDEKGLFNRRVVLPEIFDRKIVEAVLQEWYRTIADLPAGIRQAFQMGLISSAQMVRFLSINARPTLARAISRAIPPSISRAFIGRMIADPAFLYNVFLEQIATIGYSTWQEVRHRGNRIREEWDYAAINILTLAACNLVIVCSLAPSRSYGTVFKYDFQNTIQKLPNHVFDKSYPLREFDMRKRLYSFFYKVAELSLAGMAIGTSKAGLSKLYTAVKKRKDGAEFFAAQSPKLQVTALGYGALLGISGNLRYQLIYGAERLMRDHFENIGLLIVCSSVLRLLNIQIGDAARVAWLGIAEETSTQHEGSVKAYRRPSVSSSDSNSWASPSVLLEKLKQLQGNDDNKPKLSNPFAKRKVKRRVLAVH